MKKVARALCVTIAIFGVMVVGNKSKASDQETGPVTHWTVRETIWCDTGNPMVPMFPSSCCSKVVSYNPGADGCVGELKHECCIRIGG